MRLSPAIQPPSDDAPLDVLLSYEVDRDGATALRAWATTPDRVLAAGAVTRRMLVFSDALVRERNRRRMRPPARR